MAEIPATRIMRLKIMFDISGNRLSNILHYSNGAVYNHADMAAVVAQWEADKFPLLKAIVSDEVTFHGFEAHGVVAGTQVPIISPMTMDQGDLAEEALPSNIAGVIQLRQTEVSGKHNGRMLIAGLTEDSIVDGLIDSAFAAGDLKTFADGLLTPFSTGPTDFFLCTCGTYPGLLVDEVKGYRVTQARVMRNLATQRRRRTELRGFHV